MAEVTAFRGILQFFEKIGVYDVVLPFLLVFSIVFAILEKTKVLGVEKIENKEYTKKNLNAMVAFVVSFLVIASSRLVQIITTVSAQVVVLLMASVLFLLLVGSFFKEGSGVFLEGGWRVFFMWIMFIGILLIFMNALGWLENFWGWVSAGSGGYAAGSIILIIIVIFFMWFVVKTPEGKSTVKKE
jgi:hypothetical protein